LQRLSSGAAAQNDGSGRSLMQRQSLFHAFAGVTFGAALGAGVMYLLDPTQGRARRARLLGRLRPAGEQGAQSATPPVESDHAAEEPRGLAAVVRARLLLRRDARRLLEARVRARVAQIATNPTAISITADGSRVTLRGSVPPSELDEVLDEVASIPGVEEVYNLLQVQLAAPMVPGRH
jgi:hypothetical protein